MAALTDERNTIKVTGSVSAYPCKGGVRIFKGSLVARVTATGLAIPGQLGTGLEPLGRAMATVDNRGGAAGAQTVYVEHGVFAWDNDGEYPVTSADYGKVCFIRDDHTVSLSAAGGKSPAGTIRGISNDLQVLVDTAPLPVTDVAAAVAAAVGEDAGAAIAAAVAAITDGQAFSGAVAVTSVAPQLSAQSFGSTSEIRARVAAGSSGSPAAATTANTSSLTHYGWDGSTYALGGALTIAPTETYSILARGTQATLTLTPTGGMTPAVKYTFAPTGVVTVPSQTYDFTTNPFWMDIAGAAWTQTTDQISVNMGVSTTGTILHRVYFTAGSTITAVRWFIDALSFTQNGSVITARMMHQTSGGVSLELASDTFALTGSGAFYELTGIDAVAVASANYWVALEITQPAIPSTGTFYVMNSSVTSTSTRLGSQIT